MFRNAEFIFTAQGTLPTVETVHEVAVEKVGAVDIIELMYTSKKEPVLLSLTFIVNWILLALPSLIEYRFQVAYPP
jgi:hypothetical protein